MAISEIALKEITSHFSFEGDFVSAQAITAGHIHDSFRVNFGARNYFLQRINHLIFTDPAALMENIERVTRHIAAESADPSRALHVIRTRAGGAFLAHDDGTFWRAFNFVEGTHTRESVTSAEDAYRAAFAFGEFQRQLVDLPGGRLHETIPNFHNTLLRFAAFEKALAEDAAGRAVSVKDEIAFALERRAVAHVLLDAHLPERATHNDTKLSNVLLDDATGEPLCVVDLDIVMPGLAGYDFGDLVRTAATTAAEDEPDLSRVVIDLALFEALVRGYLASTRGLLTNAERASLPAAGKLITFEQGVRFLGDYLNGDTYYKVRHPQHNLERTRAQFQLVRSIEANEAAMGEIVAATYRELGGR